RSMTGTGRMSVSIPLLRKPPAKMHNQVASQKGTDSAETSRIAPTATNNARETRITRALRRIIGTKNPPSALLRPSGSPTSPAATGLTPFDWMSAPGKLPAVPTTAAKKNSAARPATHTWRLRAAISRNSSTGCGGASGSPAGFDLNPTRNQTVAIAKSTQANVKAALSEGNRGAVASPEPTPSPALAMKIPITSGMSSGLNQVRRILGPSELANAIAKPNTSIQRRRLTKSVDA